METFLLFYATPLAICIIFHWITDIFNDHDFDGIGFIGLAPVFNIAVSCFALIILFAMVYTFILNLPKTLLKLKDH